MNAQDDEIVWSIYREPIAWDIMASVVCSECGETVSMTKYALELNGGWRCQCGRWLEFDEPIKEAVR